MGNAGFVKLTWISLCPPLVSPTRQKWVERTGYPVVSTLPGSPRDKFTVGPTTPENVFDRISPSLPPTRIPRLPLGSRWSQWEPSFLFNGISSSFPQTGIPRPSLGSWWSQQEHRLTGSPLRFPHLQNSTSPTQAPLQGERDFADFKKSCTNQLGQYSIPSFPALAWSVPNIEAIFTIQLVDSNSRLPAACLQVTLTNGLTVGHRAVAWLSASFLILAALITLAAVTIAPSSFLITAPILISIIQATNNLRGLTGGKVFSTTQDTVAFISQLYFPFNQQPGTIDFPYYPNSS
ncbi:hypothetical protein PTTG_25771 [Puccinia triticina 1-1 BBBD Race 1]|uniref:TRP_N domain-containing protein n=1 Tax=Puccinia triticina (isolate 1-1 / race 1 (BBBD)) TaxID=630390 RepID=A0A180GZT5_PUCT1|nr:hypothetical protein PTTG_25771 [Puccinia triticina 1-1 BBBD Race 1]